MMFLQIMFWMDFDEIEVSASASTNLGKYSVVISMYFLCRTTIGKGLSKSMPHKSKGHAPEMEIISYRGT
jgi:hypothetical protein